MHLSMPYALKIAPCGYVSLLNDIFSDFLWSHDILQLKCRANPEKKTIAFPTLK